MITKYGEVKPQVVNEKLANSCTTAIMVDLILHIFYYFFFQKL